MASLIITDATNQNKTNIKANHGKNPKKVTPSTAKMGPESTPRKVSFANDPSLTQASAVSMDTETAAAFKGYEEDIWLKEADGTSGRTGRTKRNKDGDNKKPPNRHKNNDSDDGLFTKACLSSGTGGDMVKAANDIKKFFQTIAAKDKKLRREDRIRMIAEQQTPFPFLAVTETDNKVVVVHGICRLSVPLEEITPMKATWSHSFRIPSTKKHCPRSSNSTKETSKKLRSGFTHAYQSL